MSDISQRTTRKALKFLLDNRFNRFAWIPIPLFLTAMIILYFADLRTSHESTTLLMGLDFIFSTLASTLVVVLIGLAFVAHGDPGLLMLGCGALFWGAAGTISPGFGSLGYNVMITINNVLVWFGAICYFSGAVISLKPRRPPRLPGFILATAYAGTFCLSWLIVMLTIAGWMPVFIAPGHGGTLTRSLFLGSAIAMFVGASVILWQANRTTPSAFVRWYGAALLLAATGLLAAMFVQVHGGALSWTGRAARFLGGSYMFLAAIAALYESGLDGISLTSELREARQIYHTLVDISPQAILVHADGKYLFVNPAAVRLYGANRPEDLLGRDVLSLIHPDYREIVAACINPTTQKPRTGSAKQIKILRLDGRTIDAEAAYALIEFRGRQAVQVFLRDITEAKQVEKAIIHAKEQWEQTFDSVPDLIAVLDDKHRVVRANRAMALKLGCEPRECIGKTCFEVVHGMNEPPDFCPHSQTLKDGIEHITEVHEERLGGDFLVSTTPLKDEHGATVGSVHVARDITGRKKVEEELQAINNELMQFNLAAVGRELRMIELKKEINALCAQAGLPARYSMDLELDFEEEQRSA